MSRLKYFAESLVKTVKPNHINTCPYCKTILKNSTVVDTKYAVTKLLECSTCNLLVRTPTDSIIENKEFYQTAYKHGYTTDCPPLDELKSLKDTNFKDTERDYSRYIEILKNLGCEENARVVDFGCSWGYGLFQLENAGFNAYGYEISEPRCRYGRENLNVKALTNPQELPEELDVFFSSHVLEHVPDLKFVFELAFKKLKPGGLFIAVTPNGSKPFRKKQPTDFHHLWGQFHPILLSDDFIKSNFSKELQHLGSLPPETASEIYRKDPDQYELFFVLKKAA